MYLLEKTIEFDKWLRKLKDRKAKAKILFRLQRVESGNLGDFKSVSHGLSELRIPHGKGYRIYYKKVRSQLILLLVGGDKSTQERDIEKAKKIWDEYKNQNE
ncbi:MAG: putative addiction module killer protein [Psychromonas sp.]